MSAPSRAQLCEHFEDDWHELDKRLLKVDEIARTPHEDPREIYGSLYNARKELEALREDLIAELNNCSSASLTQTMSLQGQLAHVWTLIGRNMIMCKEISPGNLALARAQKILDGLRMGCGYDFKADKPTNPAVVLKLETRQLKEAECDPLGVPRLRQGQNTEVVDCQLPTIFDDPDYTFAHLLVNVYNLLASSWLDLLESAKAEASLRHAQHIFQDWLANTRAGKCKAEEEAAAPEKTEADVFTRYEKEQKAVQSVRDLDKQNQMDALQRKLEQKRANKARSNSLEARPATGAAATASSVGASVAVGASGSTENNHNRGLETQESLELAVERMQEEAKDLLARVEQQSRQRELTPWELRTRKAMEEYYAFTIYYLGQTLVTQNRDKEAAYCYVETMQYQLKNRDYDRQRWVQSCLWLGQFYLDAKDLPSTLHCLQAVEVLRAMDSDEELQTQHRRLRAEYQYRMLKLCSEVREIRQQCKDQHIGLGPDHGVNDEELEAINACLQAIHIKVEVDDSGLRFCFIPRDDIPRVHWRTFPIDPPAKFLPLAQSLEEATALFDDSFEKYQKCLEEYDIDTHTEERIYSLQEVSDLLRSYAVFLPDPDRRVEMHQRRFPFLKELFPKLHVIMFANVLRQLWWECAAVNETMAAERLKQRKTEGTRQYDGLINGWLHDAIGYYQQFIDNFHYEFDQVHENHLKAEDKKKPFRIEPGYAEPYMMAAVKQAQCYTKMIPPNSATRCEYLDKAIERHEFCQRTSREAINRDTADVTGVDDQARLSGEMIELLKVQMEHEQAKHSAA